MSSLQYNNEEGYGEACGPLFHYSQSVTIGNIVKISGQGGWTFDGSINLDGEDIKGQVNRAFDNVERVLQAAGLKGWEDVYSVRSYHADLDGTLQMTVDNFKARMPNHKPIWTCVGVKKLAFPGMAIEIEVEACKGS